MSANKYRSFLIYSVGALTPILFFGWWWLPAAPLAYWAIKRSIAYLPSVASVAQMRAREEESLFFLAALSGSLKGGLPLLPAIASVISLLSTSLKRDIEQVYSLLSLGSEPGQAWAILVNDALLAPAAKELAIAQRDGRSLAYVVERASLRSYEIAMKRSKERVKSLSVKLSLPVGLCFLPSFLIGGIGPIIYSFFASFASLNLF